MPLPFIVALIAKELQTWLRARFAFALFGALVLGLSALVFLLGLLIMAPDANAAPALFNPASTQAPATSGNVLIVNRALFLFGAVAACLLLASAIVSSGVAASAFAGEREGRTLDLLLVQGVGAGRLVWGKVLAAMLFSLLVLAVGLPLFAPSWSFGGVQPEQIGVFAILLLSSTLLFCALGVFFGSLVQSALAATLLAQAVALALFFGVYALHMALTALAGSDVLRPALWVNPFLALISGGGSAADGFARIAPQPYRANLSLPAVTWIPGVALPAWAIASSVWTLTALILVAITSVVIEPCHPLKVRRARAR